MSSLAADIARRLARCAEAVCRHYLSNGRREGRYWLASDVANTPGRSLYVRLTGPNSGKGAAGKWTDAATGEHGDLLDLIGLNLNLDLRGALDEARSFLSLPSWDDERSKIKRAPHESPASVRRLYAMSKPISGTIAETYLRKRGITVPLVHLPLRFHPCCYYRSAIDCETEIWPALIATVTTENGAITGIHRTWLDPLSCGKAPVPTPRRAMGQLLGNAVRFGTARDVLAAGEGIETVLSLRSVLPSMPMIAALSANHLAAVELPRTLPSLCGAR